MSAILPDSFVDAAIARICPEPDPYINDPVRWVNERLNKFLWSKQRAIMEAVRDHPYVAVKSCHGPGKSFTASAVVAWWLACHNWGEAFAVTTAPSWSQVQAILWREIRRRAREGNLPGRITLDCVWHMSQADSPTKGNADEEMVGMGRKPADYDETTFQGIHARYFLAVLDEACGIPEPLWDGVLSLATNENSRILAIGNPDDPNSRFAKICKDPAWHVITISAFDTPAYTGEDVPAEMLLDLVSKRWVADRTRDWGEGSPIWTSKVLGEFPDVSDDYLFPPGLMEKAFQTDLPGLERGRYGVDLARYGDDRSVMYRNRGGQIRLAKWWSKKDTAESTQEIKLELDKHGVSKVPCSMDIIGLGAGPFDFLRAQRYEVAGVQGSERAFDFKKFRNRRSEIYWTFREMMEQGAIDLDREDEKLAGELMSIKWGITSSGQIYIEPKEDIKDRGLPSPDHADAAVLSTVAIGSFLELNQQKKSITHDLMRRKM